MNEFPAEQERPTMVRQHSRKHRSLWVIPGLLLIGTIAAACGSSTSTVPPGTTGPGGGGGGQTAVQTKNGQLGTILVDSKGDTLYRLSTDSTNKSNCDSACQQIWPPLLVSGGGRPMGAAGLGTISVSGGQQVTYNGMPLYTFSGDSSPGQTNGQNVKDQWGTWFVVVTKGSSKGGGATTTTAGGGGIGF